MKIGLFQAPFTSPHRTQAEGFKWAVDSAVIADQAGLSECWIGEHATLNWESIPNPELVIAAAAGATTQVHLGPLAHLLPYHHPATLAVQASWMSHILKGRYLLGVATGAYKSDAVVRGISDMSVNFKMMLEALDIMERVWRGEPFNFEGQFWKAGWPEPDPKKKWRDVRPWGGKIQMAMTGLSAPSSSLAFAASRDFIPTSIYTSDDTLRSHFATYRDVSAQNGRTRDRSTHRVARDVLVADTDAEALRLAKRYFWPVWREYLRPTFQMFGLLQGMLHDPSLSTDVIDENYLAEHVWLCGSPQTVARKIRAWSERLGGPFGTLLVYNHDFIDDPKPWQESLRRLVHEVVPKL